MPPPPPPFQKSSIGFKCAVKFEKVPKCGAGAKRLSTDLHGTFCNAEKPFATVSDLVSLEFQHRHLEPKS